MQNYENSKIAKDEHGEIRSKNQPTKVLSRTTMAHLGRNRTSLGLKTDHSKDKELINNGLQKLVSTINQRTNQPGKVSKMTVNDSKIPITNKESELERNFNSNILLQKQISIDKYTMTDFELNERKLEEESTVLNDQTYDSPGRALQWTDSRLIKKYSMTKKPYKKSFTIPFVSKGDYESEGAEEEPDVEQKEAEILYSPTTQYVFKAMYYFCTTSVSFIGSFCGITLITLILSKLVDETFWNFRFEAPKNEFILKTYFNYGISTISYIITSIIEGITNFLTLPVSFLLSMSQNKHMLNIFLYA